MTRTVLVTGGCGRIGGAIAAALASAGWKVARSSSRRGAGAELFADLSAPSAADALYAAAKSRFGAPPLAIVNNAALFSASADALDAVNFRAPVRLAELLAAEDAPDSPPHFRRAVVNILDCRVLRPGFVPSTHYERTKAELCGWTLEKAASMLPRARLCGVAPGPVFPPPGESEKAGPAPLGRPSAQAVADAVVFALSAEFSAGFVIPVDGAQSLVPATS